MAYTDVAEMATDDDLQRRLYACIATMRIDNGAMWVDRWVWLIVAGDPAWATAWATAHTAPVVLATAADGTKTYADDTRPERPGWASTVITDQMILDRIRAVWEEKGQI